MYMVIFGGIRWGIHWSSWLVVLGHRRQKNCWSRQHLGIWPSDAIAASLSYQRYLSTGTPVATAISALACWTYHSTKSCSQRLDALAASKALLPLNTQTTKKIKREKQNWF